MLAMIITSGAVESMKKMIFVSAFLPLFHIPLLAALVYFSSPGQNADTVYYVTFAASAFAAVFYGIHGVLSYKLPYKIMDIKEYGRILGISGIFLGLFSTVFSFIISYFTNPEHFDYFRSMRVFFLVGILLFVLNFFVAASFKEIPNVTESSKKDKKINIFKYKPFYVLLVPNLLRGFHTGIWGVILVIGNNSGIVDGKKGALLTVLLQLALMIGCFVYSKISNKIADGKLIFISSIAVAVITPFMVVGKNSAVFLTIYLVVSIIKNFIDYGVPTAVTKIADYRCIGQYSAWRMVLHTLGTALGGIAVTGMISLMGTVMTLVAAGLCQALSGAVYWAYMRNFKKS